MPVLDKYAPYVLACYGLAVAVIAGLTIWSMLRLAAAKKRLDALEADKVLDGGAGVEA